MIDHLHQLPREWRPPVSRLRLLLLMGWWWQRFFPWMIAGALVASVMAWNLRGLNHPTGPGWWSGAGLILVGILGAGATSPFRRVTLGQILARLDEGWAMGQSLIRAASGVGAWPDLPADRPPLPLRVRWQVWAPHVAVSLLFVALSQWIPIREAASSVPRPRETPREWTEMETLVEALQEEEIMEPEALLEVEEGLDRLQALPEQDWYGPAGLEATDRLRERVRMESVRLAEGMRQTADLLQVADFSRSDLPMNERSALQQELQDLLEQMGQNGLPLRADQLNDLRQVDLRQLEQISEEQLRQLQDQLREEGRALEEALVAAGLLGPEGLPLQVGTEGGGDAELGIGSRETIGNPTTPVVLDLRDPESVQTGDLMEVREIEHGDSSAGQVREGGAISSPGGSGAATWRLDLPPTEQEVLQRFFQSNPSNNVPTVSP